MLFCEVTGGSEILLLQLLLVDKKIINPKDMFKILDSAVKEKYPVVIVAEGIEQQALGPVIRNKLKGVLKAVAIKAPAFGERKSHCLDDLAILTGGSRSNTQIYFGFFQQLLLYFISHRHKFLWTKRI